MESNEIDSEMCLSVLFEYIFKEVKIFAHESFSFFYLHRLTINVMLKPIDIQRKIMLYFN